MPWYGQEQGNEKEKEAVQTLTLSLSPDRAREGALHHRGGNSWGISVLWVIGQSRANTNAKRYNSMKHM